MPWLLPPVPPLVETVFEVKVLETEPLLKKMPWLLPLAEVPPVEMIFKVKLLSEVW